MATLAAPHLIQGHPHPLREAAQLWPAALAHLDPHIHRAQARRLLREVQDLRERGALVAVDQAQACRHRSRDISFSDRQARISACLEQLRQAI